MSAPEKVCYDEDDLPYWVLARRYPEVLDAHAQFGGNPLEMLYAYHRQVRAEQKAQLNAA